MEILKEKIEVKKQSALGNKAYYESPLYNNQERYNHWCGVIDAYQNDLDLINQELQDYTFIRAPKKVKLSEIVERLQEEVCKSFNVLLQKISQFTKYIVIQNLEDEDDTKFVVITENEIEYLENQDTNECEFFPKWLYAMYIAGTEIEVDI